MNKFSGKFEKLHEETLYRHQQGGFLRGDYAMIKKNALKNEIVEHFSDQLKGILLDAIRNETLFRISYIKSGQSEAFAGPVDAPNIPAAELWADVYVEHAPGMWHNVMTLPLSILEKIEVEGANGYPQYSKKLIRPNTEEPGNPDKELKDQTKGDDSERKLPKKNTKLANTKEPKDGRKQTPFKESIGFGKENDLIFENYQHINILRDKIMQQLQLNQNLVQSIAKDQNITEDINFSDNKQAAWEVFDLVFNPLLKNGELDDVVEMAQGYGLSV